MTENKRYNIKPSKIIEDGFCIQDDEREHSFPTVDDKSNLIMYEKALNEQEETINELKQRNQRQYDRLKELTELMYEKQWEKLENMVEEWEKQEELLEQEWNNCEDL